MKYIITLIIAAFISINAHAQDTIYYKKVGSLVVLVKEVSQTEIQYKKLEMPDGPTYVINKSDVQKIVYKNGYVDVFKDPVKEEKPATQNQEFTVVNNSQPQELQLEKITFQDTKRRYYSMVSLINRHPDLARRPDLMDQAKKIKNLKRHQNGTRSLGIAFGGVAIGGLAMYSIMYSLGDETTNAIFATPPLLFGTLAVISTGVCVAVSVNLKKKRTDFVNYYNQ